VLTGLTLPAIGCASKRPVLYPNETYNRVGGPAAGVDVDECIAFAAASGLTANQTGRTAVSTASGSAIGAAMGGAWGAVRGRAGQRAAAGAAAGAAGGLVRGLLRWRDPDPVQARFVGVCLRRQGYEVVGWK